MAELGRSNSDLAPSPSEVRCVLNSRHRQTAGDVG
jgi:hypothetical protein